MWYGGGGLLSTYEAFVKDKTSNTTSKDNYLFQGGDVVIIKGEEKNRRNWRLGIVAELITGRDGVVRGAKLRAGKSYLERPVQHLYPLELSCDMTADASIRNLDPKAPVFRPTRNAAVAAKVRIQDQADDEELS